MATSQQADWRWQMAHRITDLDALAKRLPGLTITSEMRRAAGRYPFAVTPYYLSLVETPDPSDPILRQCLPDPGELDDEDLADDELGEFSKYSPVPGLIHRYPDRVVVVSTHLCPTYCRHCMRKRVLGQPDTPSVAEQAAYLREHPEIKDVIVSGGDVLTMNTERLEQMVKAFRDVPSVEIVRIGTRAPSTLPMRVDDELCSMLQRYHPVWVNTQFNHPREITALAAEACDRMLRHGIPVNNQTVLLRGVNDSPETMEALCRALLRIRVRPYYLFQCDPVAGVGPFRTPVSRGIEIMQHLYRTIGGLGVPRFAVDGVGGAGKVPIHPNTIVEHADGRLVLRNANGELITYPDVADELR
jgi:lysine 2,3-aminomutase